MVMLVAERSAYFSLLASQGQPRRGSAHSTPSRPFVKTRTGRASIHSLRQAITCTDSPSVKCIDVSVARIAMLSHASAPSASIK